MVVLLVSGGTLWTAGGLVFQGRADGRFRAYRATNGAVLWEYAQETGIGAAPVTYAVGETQYIAVLAGWGGPEVLLNTALGQGSVGPGRLLVFALDGKATLPDPQPAPPPIPAPTVELRLGAAEVEAGRRLFADHCAVCHGLDAKSSGIVPDLRRTTAEVHGQINQIVLGGIRAPLGMPRFLFLRTALNAIRRARGEPDLDAVAFLRLMREKLKLVDLREDLLKRAVNAGFSGGEKKRDEIFQMALLEPRLAILDETDSGLDSDALRIVADGVNALRSPDRAMIVVTHYQRLLDYIEPDFVHVLAGGRILRSGDNSLALELEDKGYGWITGEAA